MCSRYKPPSTRWSILSRKSPGKFQKEPSDGARPLQNLNGKSVSTHPRGRGRQEYSDCGISVVANILRNCIAGARRLSARRRLGGGETREGTRSRPQIIWNGARIRVTRAGAATAGEGAKSRSGDGSLSGAARIGRTGPISSCKRRRFIFRKKSTPRRSSTSRAAAPRRGRRDERRAGPVRRFQRLEDPEKRTEFYQHDQHGRTA